jgi:hypothetical protein
MRPYYWTGLFLALFATAVVYFLTRSRIGLALTAIREDETAAAANGINILKYKIFAFSVGAFLSGLGGSLTAYYLFHISPESVLLLKWTPLSHPHVRDRRKRDDHGSDYRCGFHDGGVFHRKHLFAGDASHFVGASYHSCDEVHAEGPGRAKGEDKTPLSSRGGGRKENEREEVMIQRNVERAMANIKHQP